MTIPTIHATTIRETITRYADSIGAKYGETAVLITSADAVASLVYCS